MSVNEVRAGLLFNVCKTEDYGAIETTRRVQNEGYSGIRAISGTKERRRGRLRGGTEARERGEKNWREKGAVKMINVGCVKDI